MWMCVWELLFSFFFVPFSFSIVYRVWSHIVDVCQTDNTLQIGFLRLIVKMFWYFIACIIIIVIIIVKRFTNNNNTHILTIHTQCAFILFLCSFFFMRFVTDWIVFYDKSMSCCHRHPIFRNEKTWNGTYATRKSPLHININNSIQHK